MSIPENESEFPDLIIDDGLNKFGLEVTEIFKDQFQYKKGSKQRGNESNREKLLKEMRSNFSEQSRREVDVRIVGNLNADNSEGLVPEILKHINGVDDDENPFIEFEYNNMDIFVYVRQLGYVSRLDWICIGDRAGYVKYADPSVLDRCIEQKSRNLNKYQTNVESVRLLVVADRINNSGKIDFTGSNIENKHGFDKIYLLSYPSDAVHF